MLIYKKFLIDPIKASVIIIQPNTLPDVCSKKNPDSYSH